jgi:fluoride ion exporter CrcB/FEX
MGDKVVNVFGSIVILAIITTLVLPKRQTPAVISSLFNGFNGAIKAGIGPTS